ncbi:MAG TPA: S8 family serine peptidase, partial [Steroidobacteraceae bacterium]|nr:S8 family serine peptidase [Steroidobacteraceae bacterium]
LAVLTTMAAVAAVSTMRHPHLRPSIVPGNARLHVFGVRSAQQRQSAAAAKFDGPLADLSRHAGLARPGHAVEDLRSLAPAVRFKQSAADAAPLVLIDAVTRGDPQQLKSALVALGLQHPAVYSNDVGGWLPVAQLDAASETAEVHSIRAAIPHTRTGAVTSQGDFVEHSDIARSGNSVMGTGVTVGVLSDSFDCYSVYAANNVPAGGAAGYANNGFLATYATDVSTGDLPSNVNVLEEAEAGNGGCMNYGAPTQLPFGDEGRAMLQIVYDVAPGTSLAFYTAENSEADFASGIGKLATAGAKVIADDVGYFDEPFFQDGIVAQAINAVEGQGVAYFSAAGNDGTLAYDNLTPSFNTTSTSAPNSGEKLLNFDATGATTVTSLPVTIAALVPGEFVAIVVEWDQPYVTGAPNSGGATSQIDLCITGASGTDEIEQYNSDTSAGANCSGPNATNGSTDPYQVMIVANPANASGNTAAETLNLQIGLAGGTTPGRIKVAVEDDGAGSTINGFQTNTATLQGHPGAAGAAAVGAAFYFNTPACGTTPAQLEGYSSEGGAPILFDVNGTRLVTPVVRQKPDFVGPDGGNDTFLGFTLASQGITGSNGLLTTSTAACQNHPSYPNFFGTSAATPHAAGIAALMLQAKPTATPTEIYQALSASALSMGAPSPNQQSGYGLIQANIAFATPALSLGSSTVAVGGSTTLTWSTINATACTASGSWTGALAANGSQTVTVTAAGTNQYVLTCTNAAGASGSNSVNLTTVAPAVPALMLSPTSITLGQSATISWSSSTAASCAASGSWSGPLPTSGSQVLTPVGVGSDTYALECSNALGTATAVPVTLAVTAPPAPAAPTLTLAATSITVGNSTTITWSSATATSCSATGSWTGTLASSGTQTLTPAAGGTDTYTLTCTNAGGTSPASTATLTVTGAVSSGVSTGHGGGAIDVLTLLGLAGVGLARILERRRRVLI